MSLVGIRASARWSCLGCSVGDLASAPCAPANMLAVRVVFCLFIAALTLQGLHSNYFEAIVGFNDENAAACHWSRWREGGDTIGQNLCRWRPTTERVEGENGVYPRRTGAD